MFALPKIPSIKMRRNRFVVMMVLDAIPPPEITALDPPLTESEEAWVLEIGGGDYLRRRVSLSNVLLFTGHKVI